jgi:hypothetical protein
MKTYLILLIILTLLILIKVFIINRFPIFCKLFGHRIRCFMGMTNRCMRCGKVGSELEESKGE